MKKWSLYAEYELGALSRWQKTRIRSLSPFLGLLTKMGITANHLSFMSGLFGLLFAPFALHNFSLAIFFLVLHMLFDGFDGTLAHYQKRQSNAGMFADFMADLMGIASTTIGVMLLGMVTPIWGILYLFVYTVIVFFGLLHSILGARQRFAFRARFWVYAAIIANYLLPSLAAQVYPVQAVMQITTLVMLIVGITDFLRLRSLANL